MLADGGRAVDQIADEHLVVYRSRHEEFVSIFEAGSLKEVLSPCLQS